MRFIRVLCTAVFLAGAGLQPAVALPAGLPSEYVVPGDRAFPGGIAYDPSRRRFFVGSTQEGTLFEGNPSLPRASVWLPGGAAGRSTTSGLEIDRQDRLYVGGGPTGKLWIHDLSSRRLLVTLQGLTGGFVNDLTIAQDGTAYATDSLAHVVYRIELHDGRWRMEPWLDLRSTGVELRDGHNFNGIIAATRETLLTVNSQTGRLYRIDISTRAITELQTDAEPLFGGDGLVLRDGTLYVVQGGLSAQSPRAQVAVLALAPDLSSASLRSVIQRPDFRHPSTARLIDDRLLVVNSQYATGQAGGQPDLPFTISVIVCYL
ncbi:SMP-30/gluconolactonase/LRE family protein [Kribbella sp. NPDC056345]|uniref:SMP-30/gluconolactonase/LRE family protein n=1 Tax=Kribbella sp. NPDC056345 TaxID=3345789 RepID=UPI0035E1A87D